MAQILTAAAAAVFLAAAVVFLILWRGERARRLRTEQFTLNTVASLFDETEKMICQGVETLTQKLDALAEGVPLDAGKMDLIGNLNELLGYSMDQALKAAKPDWSDGA